ncbi:MAG TPA: response regulator [Chitinophagaceae bacterium]|nr:response regulator [Chitinophagaceae bacterium]
MKLPEQLSALTILLAEDDLDDQELLNDAFAQIDPQIHVQMVSNGKKVVEYLNSLTNQQLPGLVILDYNMPELDGAQVLQVLNQDQRLQGIPKLVWSTSSSRAYKSICLELGARAYFEKPNTVNGLQEMARTMLQFCA